MTFDPLSFEHDETPGITIADGAVGKLNIVIYAVLTIVCVYYLFAQWSPSTAGPVSEAAETKVTTP